MNPFSQRVDNPNKNPCKFIFYSLLYIFRAITFAMLVNFAGNIVVYVASISLIALSLTFFILSSCKDPGFIKKDRRSLLTLADTYRSEYICSFCESKKPKDTRHCFSCEKCVEVIPT